VLKTGSFRQVGNGAENTKKKSWQCFTLMKSLPTLTSKANKVIKPCKTLLFINHTTDSKKRTKVYKGKKGVEFKGHQVST